MPPISDHELRYKLSNELHARPFPSLTAPCTAVYLAIKQSHDAASRDRDADRAHLTALLDRFGAPHPQPGATHQSCKIGRNTLKWEQHTEFVTYTVFVDNQSDRAFDPALFEVYPDEWLSAAPGVRITSALIRVEQRVDDDAISQAIADWFVPESTAVSEVLDGSAVIVGDFRIDSAGHMRFATFVRPDAGARRIGRIVQRLAEIETYKTMSMLGFSRVRDLNPQMGVLDTKLTRLMGDMTSHIAQPDQALAELLSISAELENLIARSSFRFGATGAYEAIVTQRIDVLREERFEGRQTFSEFMMRRYDPAMRTVKSAESRLAAMADRAIRAAELLRTQVDVDRSAQNQALLESMDRRADLQLRLQRTVEGLSVVAISYYAVSLAGYLLYPLAGPIGVSKELVVSAATVPVVLAVWWMVRRIREKVQ